MQSVVVPGDDGVEAALVDSRQQPLIGRPPLAGVGRAVVVLEVLGDLPAPVGAEGLAVQTLALDAGALSSRVPRNAGVGAGSNTGEVGLGRVARATS